MTGSSLLIASAALVGIVLAPNPGLSTLPLAFHFLAVVSTTFPASLLMKRVGRKNGFLVGLVAAAAGATVCAYSIRAGSFVGYCAGVSLMGIFNAFGQYYRFAAADVATEAYRSRAISLVLAGGLVAEFAGPNLANVTKDLVAGAAFSGGYASLIIVYLISMLVVAGLRVPAPTVEEQSELGRPLIVIARQPTYVVAVVCVMIAYGVMNLLMTSTPLAMQHNGHAFSSAALVIEWHIVGMYAPSFFTGHLIARFGIIKVMMAGTVILAFCVVTTLMGDNSVGAFLTALAFLGVGWNFLFVGGTTLLTTTYAPAEKAKAQGLNDLFVFAAVAVTALSSGLLHHLIGWSLLNYGVLPMVAIAGVAILYLAKARSTSKLRDL